MVKAMPAESPQAMWKTLNNMFVVIMGVVPNVAPKTVRSGTRRPSPPAIIPATRKHIQKWRRVHRSRHRIASSSPIGFAALSCLRPISRMILSTRATSSVRSRCPSASGSPRSGIRYHRARLLSFLLTRQERARPPPGRGR